MTWTLGHRALPGRFEKSKVIDRWTRCFDPESRPGANYADDQYVSPEDIRAAGEHYIGIGAQWQETGLAAARVSIEWSGLLADPHHVEATPLIHVVPGTTELGIGAWPGLLWGLPVWLVGTIGSPPEHFVCTDGGLFEHTDGTPRRIELRTTGTEFTVWLDGVQQFMTTNDVGFDPMPVPAALQGSTLHGAAYDTHLVTPRTVIPSLPCWRLWRCK